ncbi:MAG: hypothetical protein KJ042_03985, partial [Deltaproteobacteria bacterium]|nr:hypothetical protein [Deltaproteobacteria bacterium]
MKTPRSVWTRILLASAALAALCVSCAGDLTPAPARFEIELVQTAAGRLVLTGRAPVPDGTWIYVEIVGDPGRLNTLWGEAAPVFDGRFALTLPFTEPLVYHARAVLSPQLNPTLAEAFGKIPERPGIEILKTDAGPEIVARLKTAIGTPAERAAAHKAVIADLQSWEKALARETEDLANGDAEALPEIWRRYARERDRLRGATPGRLIYAPAAGSDLSKWADDLDDLMRLAVARAVGTPDAAARDKALRSTRNRRA